MMFFLRVLHMFSVHQQLGPKLVMIKQMVSEWRSRMNVDGVVEILIQVVEIILLEFMIFKFIYIFLKFDLTE